MNVILSPWAIQDLEEIVFHIREHDCAESARHVLREIEKVLQSLETLPSRGRVVRELAELGITSFRERFFKPYRIIYEIDTEAVHVYLIADGRRDIQSLLQRRLLQS